MAILTLLYWQIATPSKIFVSCYVALISNGTQGINQCMEHITYIPLSQLAALARLLLGIMGSVGM